MLAALLLSVAGCGAWRFGSGPWEPVPDEYRAHLARFRVNDLADGSLQVSVYRWAYPDVPEDSCRDLVVRLARGVAAQRDKRGETDLASLRSDSGRDMISHDCSATIVVRP